MATAPTYCTHRQLKDVFPQVDSFDPKRPIYGWEEDNTLDNNFGDTESTVWFRYDSGLVTQLFKDGLKMLDLSSNLTTQVTKTSGAQDPAGATLTVDDGTSIAANDIIRVGNSSYRQVTSKVGDNTLVFSSDGDKTLFNSQQLEDADDTPVYLVVDVSVYHHIETNWFFYDTTNDLLVASSFGANSAEVNLNDLLMEAGEDFSTLITRITGNASRYLDAKLDPNLPKEQLKDKEGNFDYIIVRTTALIAATFLIRSHDPTSEVANALMEDAMGNIDALNKGGAALSWQTTGDSSKGVVRDVTYASGSIRPVDTRGRWSGSWDLLKVKITTGGVLGTAKYSVWAKSGDKLKDTQVITDETMTGDFQVLPSGLQIRFGGSVDDSVATVNDEWEIEVAGWQEEVDNSSINSVKMTRGGIRTTRFGKYK